MASLFKSFMIGQSDSLINWKRSFFSRLGPPLIHLENGPEAFRIQILPSNRNDFITKFWKHFENGAFQKRRFRDNLWFPCASFPQTQIQNERWFLGYQISRALRRRKIVNEFLEWNFSFQNSYGVVWSSNGALCLVLLVWKRQQKSSNRHSKFYLKWKVIHKNIPIWCDQRNMFKSKTKPTQQ